MGVDFCCEDKSFSCSYSAWNSIRRGIIYATYLYVLEQPDGDERHNEYKHYLLTLFDSLIVDNVAHTNAVNIFVKHCHYTDSVVDSLNYFGVVGLYALCYKSDCDGFYSPGNSLDICILLDKLREIFDKHNIENFRFTDRVYDVFDTSYKTMNNVWIL